MRRICLRTSTARDNDSSKRPPTVRARATPPPPLPKIMRPSLLTPVVVDRAAGVGDRDPPLDSERVETSGDRVGGDDIAGDHDQLLGEPRQRRRPGAGREHHGLGANRAPGGGEDRRRGLLDPGDGSLLADRDAEPLRGAAQPSHQPPRVDRRRQRLEDAGQVGRGARHRHRLGGGQPLEGFGPERRERLHGPVPGADLVRIGRRPDPSRLRELGIDAMVRAEGPISWIAFSTAVAYIRASARPQVFVSEAIFDRRTSGSRRCVRWRRRRRDPPRSPRRARRVR